MTFKLGLTGSMGMGKTSTAALFKKHNCGVWDADKAVHRLYSKGGEAVKPIQKYFPEAVIEGLVNRNKLKNYLQKDFGLITLLEGIVHPLVSADRNKFIEKTKYKINVFAYQHSLVTNTHFSMFLDIDKNLSPSKILTNGEVSYNFLKKKIDKKKIIILGSNKYRNRNKFNLKSNSRCLILPTGLESETLELLKLCCKCLENKKNKFEFILRLHPHIDKKKFVEENKHLLSKVKISNSLKLDKDILLCKFVLYRGSSSVVEAMQQGLIPIYFYDNNNQIQIDPLWQLKSKNMVKNHKELFSTLKKNNIINNHKIQSYINFANKFYTPINHKNLRGIL